MPADADSIGPSPSLAQLRCHVDAPQPYRGKAEYALTTLLRPLGLTACFEPDSAGAGSGPGLWYAEAPPAGPGWLHLPLDTRTPESITWPVSPDRVRWMEWDGKRWPVLFAGGLGQEGDMVASAFYFLAGVDERVNRQSDRFGRHRGADSLLNRLGAAAAAPVDAYREMLADFLEAGGIKLRRRTWSGKRWSFCPTFDIDYDKKWRRGILYREIVQYFLLGKGPGPRLGRLARGITQWVCHRDPYRAALVRIQAELERVRARGTFYFKAGAHGPHDVSYSISSRFIQDRLQSLRGGRHEVGLHPSFFAFNHGGYIHREKRKLEEALGASVSVVRTHYLRFDWASTPQIMMNKGFSIDSTLGFPDMPGFRSGTCLPFQVWDHAANRASDLWEMPLAFMESALFNRLDLNVEQAQEVVRQLAETVAQFGGVLVGLWHNILWDELDFAGWGDHFVGTLGEASTRQAALMPLEDALAAWSHPDIRAGQEAV